MQNKKNIITLNSPFMQVLKGKEFLILDTETTGLNGKTDSLIQYAGLKIKLKKELNIKSLSDNKIEITLNDKYVKIIEFKEKINDYKYKLNDSEYLVIKENIPYIHNTAKNKNNLIFPTVGEYEILEEIEQTWNYKESDSSIWDKKTDKPSIALVVHKIYNKQRIQEEIKELLVVKENEKIVNVKKLNEFFKTFKEKELKKITSLIKKKEEEIKVLDKIDNTLSNELKKELKILQNQKKTLEEFTLFKKFDLPLKEINKIIKTKTNKFLQLLEILNYRNIEKDITFNQDKDFQKKLEKELNSTILSGHNVLLFDIQNFILPNSDIKLKNYNIIDTMFFYRTTFKKSKNISLDNLIEQTVNNKLNFFKKETWKNYLKQIPKSEEKEQLKNLIEKVVLKTKKSNSKDKYLQIYTKDLYDKIKKIIKDINNKYNIKEDFDIINVIEDIENIMKLKHERETLHDALLDIKLNTLAYETLFIEYIEKYGLIDINKKILRKSEKKLDKEPDIDIPYIGLNTEFTSGTITKNTDILKFAQENGIKELAISDEIFTNYYNDYNLFKESGIKNYLSLKLNITDIKGEHKGVNLIFKNKAAWENAKLLFDNYTITKQELYELLNEHDIIAYIHPTMDKELKHKKIFIKVSPNIMFDYKNTEFQNKRALWIGNRFTSNNFIEKAVQYLYSGKYLKNDVIDPTIIYDIIHNPEKYPNIGIPTKKELLEYFPYDEYKDIYENAKQIVQGSEIVDPEPKHISLFPPIEQILKLDKKLKTPEEFKKLLHEKLRKEYKRRRFDLVFKKIVLKNFRKNILKEITEEKNSSNPNWKKIMKIEKFINLIGPIDKISLEELKEKSLTELNFWNNCKDKEIRKELQNKLKNEYQTKMQIIKDRINYELDALTKFENYRMVFTYYFLISDILEVLEQHGITHGPGRGSAAGSIISFFLEVTKVDPTDLDLLFERFMNPERVSIPDVDVDIPYDEYFTKDSLIEILEEHFKMNDKELKEFFSNPIYNQRIVELARKKGHFRYTNKILTTSEITEKTAVYDFFRLLGMRYDKLTQARKYWNDEKSLEENLKENPIFNQEYGSIVKMLIDYKLLEYLPGLVSNFGRHAGGVKIGLQQAEEPTTDDSTSTDKRFHRNEAKFDMLGLATETALENMKSKIKEYGDKYKYLSIDDKLYVNDDPEVYKLIRQGLTASVFQIENEQLTELLQRMIVDDFETLIAAVALYRPGPLGTGDVDKFVIFLLNQKKESYKWVYNILKKEGKIISDFNDLTEEDIKTIYQYIEQIEPGKYTLKDIINIFTVKEYYQTKEFDQKIKNKLNTVIEVLENNPNIKSEQELIKEINKNLPAKEQINELETIEKEFLQIYLKEKDIKKTSEIIKQQVIKWEKEIADDPDYKTITEATNGVIVYQEQIMKLSRVTGFTQGESDALRKVVAKSQKDKIKSFRKDIVEGLAKDRLINMKFKIGNKEFIIRRNQDYDFELYYNGKSINLFALGITFEKNNTKFEIKPQKLEEIIKQLNNNPEFKEFKELLEDTKIQKDGKEINTKKFTIENKDIIDLKKQKGMNKQVAKYLFDNIVGFGSYAFNKSHAAAYAVLTYKTALFKKYAPEIFYIEMLKTSSIKSIQKLIREINTKTFYDIEQKPFKIKTEMKNINNINGDYEVDLNNHIIYMPPSILKSVKDESILLLETEQNKTRKTYNSVINLIRRVPKFDKASFIKLGIAGLYKGIDGNLNEKFYNEYGDIFLRAIREYNKAILEKLCTNEEGKVNKTELKEIDWIINLRDKILQNELYKNEIEKYQKKLNEIISQSGYEQEIQDNIINIEKLEAKIIEIPEEDLKKYRELFLKHKSKLNNYFHQKFTNIPQEIIENMKKEIAKSKIDEKLKNEEYFEKVLKGKINYDKNELAVLRNTIFKEYYFLDIDVNLKDFADNNEVRKILANEYMSADNVKKLNGNYEVFIGKTPKIIILLDKPLNNNEINSIVVNNKEYKTEKRSVNIEGKKYWIDTRNKILNGPFKDGKYEFEKDGKKLVVEIENKAFTNQKGEKILYTKYIINGQEYKFNNKTQIFYSKDGKDKTYTLKDIPLEKENLSIEEIIYKNKAKEYTKILVDNILKEKGITVDDVVLLHTTTRKGNKINIVKLLKELKPSLTMVTGTDNILNIKNESPIFNKISENDTAYNIQIYPYGYTNILFFKNFFYKLNNWNKTDAEILKDEQELQKIYNELLQGLELVKNIKHSDLQGNLINEHAKLN